MKKLLSPLQMLLMFAALLVAWVPPVAAVPDMDDDAIFHFPGGNHRLITWQVEDFEAGTYIAYAQHSRDGGVTWARPRAYLSLSPSNYVMEEFDGVYPLDGGRVLVSMLLQRPSGEYVFAVVISRNYGATWGALRPVFELSGTTIDCPALNTHIRKATPSEVELITTFSPAAGEAYIYLISSRDSGRTWSTRRLGRVPHQNPGGC